MAWKLLLAASLLLLACALLANPISYRLVIGEPLGEGLLRRLVHCQLAFLGAAALLFALGLLLRGPLSGLGRMPRLPELLLALLAVTLPLGILEGVLRPVSPVPRFTTDLYVRDPDLGWRLNPGVESPDEAGSPVRVNAKGLRGPEVPYSRSPGMLRVLYVGDSVTFGWQLAYADTFPARAAPRLQALAGRPVETINSGVGGYSPWQEALWLEREGLRYDPDLVVLSFVLNDVTEKFWLTRFGGPGEGYQLSFAATGLFERAAAQSAVAHHLHRAVARWRFGEDVQAGARAVEWARVQSLWRERGSPRVKEAWRVTLANLTRIVELCRAHDLPLVLVAFPYRYQLEMPPDRALPQRILADFAARHDLPFLDLLPPLVAGMKREGLAPEELFFDASHLTARGSDVVAGILVPFLAESGALPGGEGAAGS